MFLDRKYQNINEQDTESLESDIFLNPLIRKQLPMGHNLKFKIPEAYIRTMPIDGSFDMVNPHSNYKEPDSTLVCSLVYPFVVFATLILCIAICALKIYNFIQLIKFFQLTQAAISDKENLEQPNKEKDLSEQPNYNFCEIPGLAFAYTFSGKELINADSKATTTINA